MSGKSTRENKTIYQQTRENLDLSRAKASELMFISESRIEKIETGKTTATPEDVVAMSNAYKEPTLCHDYCASICAIGKELDVPVVERKGLANIVLEALSSLSLMERERDRLIEIAADEQISEDEMADFIKIQQLLEDISKTSSSLKMWVKESIDKEMISDNTFK